MIFALSDIVDIQAGSLVRVDQPFCSDGYGFFDMVVRVVVGQREVLVVEVDYPHAKEYNLFYDF